MANPRKSNESDPAFAAVAAITVAERARNYFEGPQADGESPIEYVGRAICADIEASRLKLDQFEDGSEAQVNYSRVLTAIAKARQTQMEIVARAAEVEQKRTSDGAAAEQWRAMLAGIAGGKAIAPDQKATSTRAMRAHQWEQSNRKRSPT